MSKITDKQIDDQLEKSLAIGAGVIDGDYVEESNNFNHLCGIAYENGDLVHIDCEKKKGPRVPINTLKWWRELMDLNPQDLAPRLDALIAKSENK